MQIIVTARNTDLGDLRDDIDQRFERLQKFEPRASRAEIVFTGEKNRVRAEALISIDRGERLHADAEGGDARSALDLLTDKLGRQLRRRHALRSQII